MIIARFSYTLSIVLILTFIVGKVLILTLLESFCHVLNYVTHAQLVRHILYTSIAASLIGDALCTTPVTSSRSSWLINRNMRGSQFAARDGNKARAMKVNMDPSRRECRPSLQGTKESCEKNSGNTTLKSGIYKTSLWRCIFFPISYPRKWTIYSPYPPCSLSIHPLSPHADLRPCPSRLHVVVAGHLVACLTDVGHHAMSLQHLSLTNEVVIGNYSSPICLSSHGQPWQFGVIVMFSHRMYKNGRRIFFWQI